MTTGHHAQWLPLAIAALLAAISFWLNQLVSTERPFDTAGFTHDPDYIVEHFTAQGFDLDGNPHHRLEAVRMTHYMDDDTTVLEMPHFTQTSPGKVPLEVRSKRGLIIGQGEVVHFLDDARATRQATADRPAMTLDGEHLRVLPDAHILTSDKPVVIRQGLSVMHGGNLYADDHVLNLQGGVTGHYEKSN
jgi:lipopolysaccharide export system protein LptC